MAYEVLEITKRFIYMLLTALNVITLWKFSIQPYRSFSMKEFQNLHGSRKLIICLTAGQRFFGHLYSMWKIIFHNFTYKMKCNIAVVTLVYRLKVVSTTARMRSECSALQISPHMLMISLRSSIVQQRSSLAKALAQTTPNSSSWRSMAICNKESMYSQLIFTRPTRMEEIIHAKENSL